MRIHHRHSFKWYKYLKKCLYSIVSGVEYPTASSCSGDLFKVAPIVPCRDPLSAGGYPDTPLSPERRGRCSCRPSAASLCGAVEIPTLGAQLPFLRPPLFSLRRSRHSALCSPRSRSPRSRRPGESTCPESGHTSGMDALKSAGRAIIKSPGVPRHTWGTSKHESEWDARRL